MYAIRGALLIQAIVATPDPRLLTGLGRTKNSIEGSLAYRLFSGIELVFAQCDLSAAHQIDALPTTEWHMESVDNSAFFWPRSSSTFQYTYVPGNAFGHFRDFHLYDITDAYFGFCYKENDDCHDHNDCQCLCGMRLDTSTHGDQAADLGRLTGCKELMSLQDQHEKAALLNFGGELTARAEWKHPTSLWVEVQDDRWCEMKMQPEQKICNSVRHALPYCVVADYTQRHAKDKETADKVVHFLAWAANYDRMHPTGWFQASRSRLKRAWSELAAEFGIQPQRYAAPSPQEASQTLQKWSDLCALIHAVAPEAWALTNSTNEEFMNRVSGKQPSDPPPGRRPILVFAAGPPSSGKSINSMTSQDFALILEQTKTKDGDSAFGDASNERSYEDFQRNTVELNVDRIVESADLIDVSKEHMSTRSRWIEALQDTKKAGEMAKMQQETGQLEYRLVRFASGIDDLSNANTQRILAMKQDCIYETMLGDRFVDWAIQFDFPKILAAGYKTVLINYQVPVPVLVQRAFDREKKTGQTPAPAMQIENDAKAAPANFMNPRLLKWIDHAISMSHVRRGETEDVFAVFNKHLGNCFTHCADETKTEFEKYDVSMLKQCKLVKCKPAM